MDLAHNPINIDGLSQIAGDYRGILCDVWGVIHNGVTANQASCQALENFRRGGGRVVLVTNAPRPNTLIQAQLDRLGVARAAYDDVVTSGDVARKLLANSAIDQVVHIGPERDLPLFEGLSLRLVEDPAAARIVVCTGLLNDEAEDPKDYSDRFRALIEAQLELICVNPDIVVERGEKLVWCAGSLERHYRTMGGRTRIVGKPHAPIYQEALARLSAALATTVDRDQVLAIGDGMPTDIRGACNEGMDALFITSGIHAADFGDVLEPDVEIAARTLRGEGLGARAIVPQLVW
jgi:HAD superfamily hydrolase (TIGR01459 family)